MEEARGDKFKRLAEKRMKVTLRQIQLIANLSNRNNYEYSDDEVKKIFSALYSEVRAAEQSFKLKLRETNFKL